MFYAESGLLSLVAYYPLNGSPKVSSGNNYPQNVNIAALATDYFGNPASYYSFKDIEDYRNFGPAAAQYPGGKADPGCSRLCRRGICYSHQAQRQVVHQKVCEELASFGKTVKK